jgi:anti-sigma B factor antagonist
MTEPHAAEVGDPGASAPGAGPAHSLSISDSSTGSRHTLRLRGELDMATVADLYAIVNRLAPVARELVLDMTDLTCLDSSGLYLVLRLRDLCRRNRCRLSFASVSPEARREFEITGLIEPLRGRRPVAD